MGSRPEAPNQQTGGSFQVGKLHKGSPVLRSLNTHAMSKVRMPLLLQWGNQESPPLFRDVSWFYGVWLVYLQYGCGSKPFTSGEHQNRWYMGVHPPQNGGIGYDPLPYDEGIHRASTAGNWKETAARSEGLCQKQGVKRLPTAVCANWARLL